MNFCAKEHRLGLFSVLLLLLLLLLLLNIVAGDDQPKGADARSTEVSVGCFSGDSFVELVNGEKKLLRHLKWGDTIQTINEQQMTQTDMIFMMDQQTSQRAMFYTLMTSSSAQLSLTGLHLLVVVRWNGTLVYLPARDVQLGDQLLVLNEGKIIYSPVIEIVKEWKEGFFAPLTTEGTLLVNGVLSSCFAGVKNHHWAQTFFGPVRWYYLFTRQFPSLQRFEVETEEEEEEEEGIHWMLKGLFEVVLRICPSTFHF